ncbi:MAG: hypothetical protein AAF492_11135 [Verrucomicrobiota bacterium]
MNGNRISRITFGRFRNLFSIGLVSGAGLFTYADPHSVADYSGDSWVTTGTSGDPINMGSREFYFFKKLTRLGGPLPLSFGLYYGSASPGGPAFSSLPDRFESNHRLVADRSQPPFFPATVELFLGLGRSVEFQQFTPPDWILDPEERWQYELKETTGQDASEFAPVSALLVCCPWNCID